MLLETETRIFVALSILDLVLTFALLTLGGFREANQLANYFLARWGITGLIAFKIVFVITITIISQFIATRQITTARYLLVFGCIAMGGVVLYSGFLFLSARGLI